MSSSSWSSFFAIFAFLVSFYLTARVNALLHLRVLNALCELIHQLYLRVLNALRETMHQLYVRVLNALRELVHQLYLRVLNALREMIHHFVLHTLVLRIIVPQQHNTTKIDKQLMGGGKEHASSCHSTTVQQNLTNRTKKLTTIPVTTSSLLTVSLLLTVH